MVSKAQQRTALQEKYQLLRSVTNSKAVNKESILGDASKYIQELKEKVERLHLDVSSSSTSSSHHHTSFASTTTTSNHDDDADDDQSSLPKVTVETLEKGFLINVFSERSCPGLLVFILECFEELGIEVLDARVSCTDHFQLQAVGGEENEGDDDLDAQGVRQAVSQAIKNWSGST